MTKEKLVAAGKKILLFNKDNIVRTKNVTEGS